MSQLSRAAQEFRQRVEDEARFLETCEGGDPGAPDRPSIWVLGIEPGWSLKDSIASNHESAERDDDLKKYSIDLQLKWPYNRNAFKLLASINGNSIDEYVIFARSFRPFEQGSSGYFKANLFPEPFNKVASWDEETAESTGFSSKTEYQDWLRKSRFSVLRSWINKRRPKLVIGTGLTHLDDFMDITGTKETPHAHHFQVNGHAKRVHVANSGTVPVAVVPHLSGGSHGLNSDEATRIAASFILDALKN